MFPYVGPHSIRATSVQWPPCLTEINFTSKDFPIGDFEFEKQQFLKEFMSTALCLPPSQDGEIQ